MFISLFRWLMGTMETAVVPFLVLSLMLLRYVVRHYDIDPLIYPEVVWSAHYDACWGNYRSHRLWILSIWYPVCNCQGAALEALV